MYKHNLKQLEFEVFNLPFDGHLRSDNRWVKLAKFIPWDKFEIAYSKSMTGSGLGPPAMSVRIALGALFIKEKLGTSDEETVEQIRENPYLQYFIGFKDYSDEEPFHPTMFVHFRKRIGKKARKEFLSVAKSKKVSQGKLRKAIRRQLGYLGRNLKTIDALSQISSLLLLDKRLYKLLLVINEVYRQRMKKNE